MRIYFALFTFVAALTIVSTSGLPGGGNVDATPGRANVRPEVSQALTSANTARVIVNFAPPPTRDQGIQGIVAARPQIAAQRGRIEASVPRSDLIVTRQYASIPALAGTITREGLAALAANPDVASIEIDGVGSAGTNQSGPLIHAPEVHSAGVTGNGVTVAVLDSGIDTDHPDLSDDIAYEKCYLIAGGCPGGAHVAEDDNGHGTNVSGIITSNGTIAPKGIAPDATIASYKILNASGLGFFSDWALALDDIITNHPEVDFVNMSLQSTLNCPSTALASAIGTLRSAGVLTFISAGNHGTKASFTIPACIDAAVTVGAAYDANVGTVSLPAFPCVDTTTAADEVACWSDSSAALDLLAPGAAITSTSYSGGTVTYYGTSQAAPHAAAVAALIRSANPALTADQIEGWMKSTGKLVVDSLNDADANTYRTTPRIDARAATLLNSADTDGDGCSDIQELGSDAEFGGQRNPLDPNDFYDTNGDKEIDLFIDIFEVAFAYGDDADAMGPDEPDGYDASLDRSAAPPGADVWHMGPPDGMIDLFTDIFGVAFQFGANCTAVP
ncbi:MAG: S8 family serine peptidase [Dehalococcoidia bacterium]